jgi:hypothetical protein
VVRLAPNQHRRSLRSGKCPDIENDLDQCGELQLDHPCRLLPRFFELCYDLHFVTFAKRRFASFMHFVMLSKQRFASLSQFVTEAFWEGHKFQHNIGIDKGILANPWLVVKQNGTCYLEEQTR